MIRSRTVLLLIIITLSSALFSLSPNKYNKYVEAKSELLLLVNKKLSLIETIFDYKKELSAITLDKKRPRGPHANIDNRTINKEMNQKRQALLDQIQNLENQIDYIDNQIVNINRDIKLYISY